MGVNTRWVFIPPMETHLIKKLPTREKEQTVPYPLKKRGGTTDNEGSLNDLGASLVAQPVKNPPAMQETPVQFLGWEDPLEEGMATHSSILAWTIPMDRGAW